MSKISSAGIGATTGPDLVTAAPLYHGGDIWFVSSALGSASNSGNDRLLPLATLQAAVDAASDGDIIVLLSTHAETISTVITLSKCLDIVGEGVSAGIPTAVLTLGGTTSNMFTITSLRVSLRGIRFMPPAATSTGNYISASTTAKSLLSVTDCHMSMNGHNTAYGIDCTSGATIIDIARCTFLSTATANAARPRPAVFTCSNSDGLLVMDDCTFDAGTVGFLSTGIVGTYGLHAIHGSTVRIMGLNLLRGADVSIFESTTGYISLGTVTGSSRVVEHFAA